MRYTFWIPLLVLIVITPFTPTIDLAVASYFYPFHSNAFLDALFNYGTYPAWIIAIGSLIAYCISRRWPFLLLALSLAIGSGLITHTLLKEQWGRARPRQITQFGGELAFSPYYIPQFSQAVPAKSFACGHCTMGFYFFALCVAARRLGSRSLYWVGWAVALGLGGALSYARMAQGGHFFSDVLISAYVMGWTPLFLDFVGIRFKVS